MGMVASDTPYTSYLPPRHLQQIPPGCQRPKGYRTQGPPNNNGCRFGAVSHIPGIVLSTSNAFNSISSDDLKSSYHKHITFLIKRTHHGTHISSIKCVASLSISLLTGNGNDQVTSVSKNRFTSTTWEKCSYFKSRTSRLHRVFAAGHPTGQALSGPLRQWTSDRHIAASKQTRSCSSEACAHTNSRYPHSLIF